MHPESFSRKVHDFEISTVFSHINTMNVCFKQYIGNGSGLIWRGGCLIKEMQYSILVSFTSKHFYNLLPTINSSIYLPI